jgi:DNA-binding response OmpR family regulator
VTVDGSPVKLTPREFDVLHVLIDERGRIVTRRALLEKIWDAGGDFVDDNTVSVTMRRLRKKLGEREYIKTVFGVGYMFADE